MTLADRRRRVDDLAQLRMHRYLDMRLLIAFGLSLIEDQHAMIPIGIGLDMLPTDLHDVTAALPAIEQQCKRKSPLGTDRMCRFKPLDVALGPSRKPAETQRTQRNILENFAEEHGHKPLYRTEHSGRRIMLLTPEHMQMIVNSKAVTPFAQRNFLNTVGVMFRWAKKEGRIPIDPTAGVTREKVKTSAALNVMVLSSCGHDRSQEKTSTRQNHRRPSLSGCCTLGFSIASTV